MIMRQKTARPEKTGVAKKFQGYKKEEPTLVRAPKVTHSRQLQEIDRIWEKYMRFIDKQESRPAYTPERLQNMDRYYDLAVLLLEDYEFERKDVVSFSIVLMSREEKRFIGAAGIYLSALINNSIGEEYRFSGLSKEILEELGFRNTKNIIITGDDCVNIGSYNEGNITIISEEPVRYSACWMRGGTFLIDGRASGSLGSDMKRGRIIVNGDINKEQHADCIAYGMTGGLIVIEGNVEGNSLGYCTVSGEITVKGNVMAEVAHKMRGGKITIHGNHDGKIGREMKGGEIHFHGKMNKARISKTMQGGKIFHRGKLIVDK